ncbi:hypothetical protein BJ165DRAFT_1530174 [Panaeolus papilionaceus]|nr:hypothetical protein BJ165DRAFT_1530174 [Panaeolus papilionaceus]
MDDQYRRGINRPNANRLTLSLGPLVAQRSLLFRIQSDLVHKLTYGELTPAEESAFFAMTPSARILSSAIMGKTPMSSASVYSQDSWKPPTSGILMTPYLLGSEDARRRAVVFSPSLQWSDLRSAKIAAAPSAPLQSCVAQVMSYIGSPVPQCVPEDFTAISPICTAGLNVDFVVNTGITIPSIEISRASTSLSPVDSPVSSPVNNHNVEVNAQPEAVPTAIQTDDIQLHSQHSTSSDEGRKLKKKKANDDASKRSQKHTSTFGRVMAHLSLQPTKKELDQRRKTAMPMPIISNPLPLMPMSRTENSRPSSLASDANVSTTPSVPEPASLLSQASLTIPPLELPSVRLSPIRTSFIANSFLSPNAAIKPFSFLSEPMVASMSEAATRAQTVRASQGPLKRRTMPPPALNLLPPMQPVLIRPAKSVSNHRRHKSSPAVINFSWKSNEEDIPPVPKLPAMIGSTLRVPM